ncbi:hypothetical protein Hamer_G016813 [Homarus americanus]|uniref:Uncharacterized protein n=1 Tax=Homarus americanus TaxID=6706 RepID=A0A8J5K121_HOMAM|nr:hypothetical protein Hamer_G016813 [Homarus americanus]
MEGRKEWKEGRKEGRKEWKKGFIGDNTVVVLGSVSRGQVKQGASGGQVKQGASGGQVKQGKSRGQVKQGTSRGQVKQGKSRGQVKQETSGEVKQGTSGGHVKQGTIKPAPGSVKAAEGGEEVNPYVDRLTQPPGESYCRGPELLQVVLQHPNSSRSSSNTQTPPGRPQHPNSSRSSSNTLTPPGRPQHPQTRIPEGRVEHNCLTKAAE